LIKKIGLRQAGVIYISMSIIMIIIDLLIIFRIMPYTWINGGRNATYEIAWHGSINGILYFVIGIPIILIASGIISVKWNNVIKKGFLIFLWIIIIYTCLGVIMQFFGTPFEKIVTSIICAVNLIMLIRLAIEKR